MKLRFTPRAAQDIAAIASDASANPRHTVVLANAGTHNHRE